MAEYLVNAYHLIARARRYEQGVALPLNLHDIAIFANEDDLPMSKKTLIHVVLAIDNAAMERLSSRK